MKRTVALVLVLVVALLSGACGAAVTTARRDMTPAQSSEKGPATSYDGSASTGTTNSMPGVPPSDSAARPSGGAAQAPAAASDRLIIRTANLSLTVKDAEIALETVKGTAAAMGGFVSNSQTVRINKDQVQVTVTVRVPAEKFDETLRQIKQNGIRVNSEQIGGQDVTEEYTDLGARLRNLEATERELLALMTTVREKTQRAEDILAVQRELNNVRMQIEQLKGRMQYLERSTAMATLTLSLVPDSLQAPVAPEVWDPSLVARDALRALVTTLQGVVSAGIFLGIYALPLILLVAVPLLVVYRLVRRPKGKAAGAG
jgi:hypothetical protein